MALRDIFRKKEKEPVQESMDFGSHLGNFSADTTGVPSSLTQEYGNESLAPSVNMSNMSMNAFGQQPQTSNNNQDIAKDLQMISLKLDAIKSEIDSVNQRLKSLEMIAEREDQRSKNRKWY